jgi:hypothetical protein
MMEHYRQSPTRTSKRNLTKLVNPFDLTLTGSHKLGESDTVWGTTLTEHCTISTAKENDYDDTHKNQTSLPAALL